MKIYYIANVRLPSPKAHSIQIMKMCEAFASQNIEVELVVPDRRSAVGDIEAFDYYGVKPIFKIIKISNPDFLGMTMRFGRLLYFLDFLVFFAKLVFLKIDKEAVVYTRDPVLLLPFLGKSRRKWVEVHDLRRRKFLFKHADGVVAITRGLKNVLSHNKIIVAPDGVDLKEFDVSISKEESRINLGLPIDKKIIMYVGLFDSWKGHKTLLKASQMLSPDIQVVMIGGMPEQIERLKKQYPGAKFLGFKPYKELAAHQKAADILVIPNSAKIMISKYFTSPLKLFAHMASGRPIVASDLPSLREILDESTAHFFTPDDPKSLAQAIEYLLAHPDEARKIAEAAYERSKEYTWKNRAGKIIEFINATKN